MPSTSEPTAVCGPQYLNHPPIREALSTYAEAAQPNSIAQLYSDEQMVCHVEMPLVVGSHH